MPLDFAATVRALAEAIVVREGGDPAKCDAATRFLLDAYARMPDHLRFGFRTATLIFDAWPLVRRGKPFHRLPPTLRTTQIAAWETSRLGSLRTLMAFYGSFAIFRLHAGE